MLSSQVSQFVIRPVSYLVVSEIFIASAAGSYCRCPSSLGGSDARVELATGEGRLPDGLFLVTVCTQLYQVSDYNVLATDENQSGEYVETSAEAMRLFPSGAFILSMQTTGALRYYTDFRNCAVGHD